MSNMEDYATGGYFPLDIGLMLGGENENYTVLHKLGHGPSSTIWLVRRELKGSDLYSFHALKVIRADRSTKKN